MGNPVKVCKKTSNFKVRNSSSKNVEVLNWKSLQDAVTLERNRIEKQCGFIDMFVVMKGGEH